MHGGRRLQGLHLGPDRGRQQDGVPDPPAGVQSRRPDKQPGLVQPPEGVALDLLRQPATSAETVISYLWRQLHLLLLNEPVY